MEKCTDQLPSFMQNNGDVYTEDDQYTLERSIMTGLQELYFSKMLCDFTIVVEGQRLQCHRVVLSSVSRYFYSMFTCCLKESRKGEVVLLEISASVMQAVLHFIYTGEASLNLDNIEELFTVSSRLMITLLQNLCSRYLINVLSKQNCLWICRMAHDHNQKILMIAATDFISWHFTNLELGEFIDVLSSNQLMVSSELSVYCLARQLWEYHGATNNLLPEELLRHIQFSLINPHEKEHIRENVTTISHMQHLTNSQLHQGMFDEGIVYIECEEEEFKDSDFTLTSIIWILVIVSSCHMRSRSSVLHGYLIRMLSTGNCLWIYTMAHCHNHTILIKAAIDFISLHFDMLSKDDDILHLDMREFTNILSSNTLMVSSELTVYALARRWWEFHSSTDNPLPEELLKFIRFSLMSSHELKELKEDVTSKVPSIQHLTSFHLRQGMYEDRIVCMDLQERENLELKDTDFPLDSYDPGSGEWKKLPSLKSLLCPGCVALGNLLYVTGGIHQDDSVSSTLHVYDSVWNDWTELSSMAGPRSMHGFLAYNHKLYAVGGWDGTVVIDSAESYNVLDKCWNRISNLPLPLRMFSSTELNGKLYLIGGETGGIYPVPVYQGILIYNTLTDIWSQFSFNIVSRSAGAVTLGNKIFVVGGYTTQTSDSNEAMPMLKATSKCFCMGDMGEVYSDCLVPPLPLKIASAGVVVWKQRIYVLGGEDREYFSDKMYYWTPGDSAWTRCTEKLPILYDGVSDFGCITMQIPLKHIKSCIPSRRLLNQ